MFFLPGLETERAIQGSGVLKSYVLHASRYVGVLEEEGALLVLLFRGALLRYHETQCFFTI